MELVVSDLTDVDLSSGDAPVYLDAYSQQCVSLLAEMDVDRYSFFAIITELLDYVNRGGAIPEDIFIVNGYPYLDHTFSPTSDSGAKEESYRRIWNQICIHSNVVDEDFLLNIFNDFRGFYDFFLCHSESF